MNNIPYKDFKRKLQDNGLREERSKGGHVIYKRTQTIAVPAHGEVNGALAHGLSKKYNLGI